MKRTAAVLVTFMLIAGACSEGKADTISLPDQTEISESTPEPMSTPEPTSEPTLEATSTPERPQVDLEDIIITVDDIFPWEDPPAEWSVANPSDNVEGDECLEQLAAFAAAGFEDGAGVAGQFSRSESGPFLIAAVSRPDGEVDAFYDNVAAAFEACDNAPDDESQPMEFPLEKFEDSLDKILSRTMTLGVPPEVALEVASTRVLDVLIMTFTASLGDEMNQALPLIMIKIMAERADPLAEPIPLRSPVGTD